MQLNKPESYFLVYLARNYFHVENGFTVAKIYSYSLGKITLTNIFYEAKINEFRNFIISLPAKPVIVLIESEDLIITSEKIPYLIGFDRLSVINRKTSQALPDGTIAHYHSKGRSATGERQEEILIFGLADSDNWKAWIQVLSQSRMYIKALTTPTLVSASSALSSGLVDENSSLIMQVSWNYGGIVQTVLERGLPIFTRFFPWITKPFSDDTREFNKGWDLENAHQESITQTKKMLLFLQGRGLWSPTLRTPLSVIIPANLADAKIDFPEIQGIDWKVVVAPSQSESLLPEKDQISHGQTLPINYGSETLFIKEMACTNSLLQCGNNETRFRFLNWRARRIVMRVMAWLLIIALIIIGILGIKLLIISYNNNKLQSEINNIAIQYSALRQRFPKINISNNALRQIIYLQENLAKCNPAMPDFIKELSKINEQHQQIELSEVEWNQGNKANQVFSEKELIGAPTINCNATFKISGNIIATSHNNWRDIENIFNNWIAAVGKTGVNTEIKTPPLDLSKGKYSETVTTPLKAKFVVIFNLKLKD